VLSTPGRIIAVASRHVFRVLRAKRHQVSSDDVKRIVARYSLTLSTIWGSSSRHGTARTTISAVFFARRETTDTTVDLKPDNRKIWNSHGSAYLFKERIRARNCLPEMCCWRRTDGSLPPLARSCEKFSDQFPRWPVRIASTLDWHSYNPTRSDRLRHSRAGGNL